MTIEKVAPSDEEVVEASSSVLADAPSLGIAKLLSRLHNEKGWILSEKRLKNILSAARLRSTGAANKSLSSTHRIDVPVSHIDRLLSLPEGVKAVYFDKNKGKGLVADRDFKEGDVIFTEDAFIAAPPAHAVAAVEKGELCTLCFAPLAGILVIPCGRIGCQARFCNRLCQSRAQSVHHALLCPAQNPSIKPFNKYISNQKWLSLSIVSRTLSRILLTHSNWAPALSSSAALDNGTETSKATARETMTHFDAFATVSELERRKRNPGWDVEQETFISAMKEGHRLLCEGMDPRKHRKGKWPVRDGFLEDVAESLFSWEAFLRMLGRSNLNTEAQGGMYLIHSHLNHSCSPNVHVTHPPSKAGIRQATKVMLIAKKAIRSGEELLITYQDPSLSLARRRLLLWREYMFGPCECDRCRLELEQLDKEDQVEMANGAWKMDEQAEEEIRKRKQHADMINGLEKQREDRLKKVGTDLTQNDLKELEEELKSSLGF